MASENTAIVTPATASPAAVAYHATQDTRSLKRPRETTPAPSPPSSAAPDISPSKIARLAEYTRQAFIPLTGAAALEERRQRRAEEQQQGPPGISSNPTQQALNHLMSGATATMSRSQDPRAEAASHSDIEAAAVAAARALGVVQLPPDNMSEGQDVSPHGTAGGESGVSMEDGDSQVVHSPHHMDMDGRADPRLYAPQPEALMDDKAVAASFSYPGPPAAMTAPPPRGMSMPMPNTQNPEMVGRSPSSNKRHKCDECQTEFTRHHNLKSHMLTHSQEKPYVCQDCNLRFRRLHDLKRHGKLHTGEKPHICPKCDRKFARGDALARHSKGAGGCAGRRPSMGSFPGDEDYQGQHDGDDSAMAGVLYENNADASMSEDGRGLSLPTIKAQQHAPGQGGQEGFAHSNTYPPTGGRPGGGLYPPNVDRGSAGPAGGPQGGPSNHAAHQIPAASMYAQSGMTESPKPLSPGGGQAGQKRSASGLSLPTHVNAQAGRGRGRTASGAAQRQEGNGPVPVPAENNGAFVGHDTGIVTYFHHLDEKVKALMADAELRNKRESELEERLSAHEHTINAQQESIMMLSNEVNSLREQLAGPQSDGAGQEE